LLGLAIGWADLSLGIGLAGAAWAAGEGALGEANNPANQQTKPSCPSSRPSCSPVWLWRAARFA